MLQTRISRSPADYYTDHEVPQKPVALRWFPAFILRSHYWEPLDHPKRRGVLYYHRRAKCNTRILDFWLLFPEAAPDPKGLGSLVHGECRKLATCFANWSRILSRCVPGNIVEHVICSMVGSKSSRLSAIVIFICVCVLQMNSNIPKGVLTRRKTYGFERHSLRRGRWNWLLSGQGSCDGGHRCDGAHNESDNGDRRSMTSCSKLGRE